MKKVLVIFGCIVLIAFGWICLQNGIVYGSGIITVSPTSLATSLSTPTPASNPSPIDPTSDNLQIINDALQFFYVLLTLILAIMAIKSFRASVAQSKETLKESRRQSEAAIDAVHKQIEESKNQHNEMIYNQSRPILVCDGLPPFDSNKLTGLKIKNVGLGVAIDIRCFLSMKSSSDGSPRQVFLKPASVLVSGSELAYDLDHPGQYYDAREIKPFHETFEGFLCFTEKGDSLHNLRFMCTYRDVFDRIHLSIFDGITLRAWKQVKLLSNVKFELPEML